MYRNAVGIPADPVVGRATARPWAEPWTTGTQRACIQSPCCAPAGQGDTRCLAPKLARLEDLGYIERRFPLTADEREQRPGYDIEDPFFRFWFRYVAGNRSRLERHRVAEVSEEVHADMDNTMGWAFERCCRRWAAAYADEKVIGAPRQIGSWWSRDGQTEIDVVGVSRHRYTLLGSCKWRRVVDNDVLDQLRDDQAVLSGRAAAARLIIFGRDQFTPALRERAATEGIRLVSAAHLFDSSRALSYLRTWNTGSGLASARPAARAPGRLTSRSGNLDKSVSFGWLVPAQTTQTTRRSGSTRYQTRPPPMNRRGGRPVRADGSG